MTNVTFKDLENELLTHKYSVESQAKRRREEMLATHPELAELDGQVSRCMVEKLRAVRQNGDTQMLDARLSDLRTALLQRMETLGIDQAELLPQYACAQCQDTGYIGTKRCNCLEQRIYQRLYEQASIAGLQEQSFENFDLAVFDGTDQESKKQKLFMDKLYGYCLRYADSFGPSTRENLIFTGPTGTGKTYLSNCIAGRVLKRGYGVVAVSAYGLVEMLRNATFNGTGELRRLTQADLLVIDELGMEQMMNNITIELLFMAINERYKRGKPYIINTNMTPAQITERYTERIASRLFDRTRSKGFAFFGKDVRLK